MALRTEVSALVRKTPVRKSRKPEEAVSPLGVVSPPPIYVDSPYFSGSLGALFGCVRERKLDLALVPLLPICEAYFSYLLQATFSDLDHRTAALSALAYLLERKAWDLVRRLNPNLKSTIRSN